ncbi:MAG: putative baseplate assembly protein [Chloroflexi bacterium RBG_16_72_14]|nr:MAG: putative baseplate assembly protein [Chloroflexi bacterium RBG_16_72_14]
MVTYDAEALRERARNLDQLNGLRQVLVDLAPAADPTEAVLDVQFWNANGVAAILAEAQPDANRARAIFPIRGGSRLPAGDEPGEVQVTGVEAGSGPATLQLHVAPIGDYSTYTLSVAFPAMDPLFRRLDFRFRPGCFTTECDPDWCPPAVSDEPAPAIDYLARDFDSFKHTLIAAMMDRVPGWRPTSEADLDETLIELLSVRADELADLQDRVMAEAYLGTARKRVSIARHARLMDYHLHQGNQASTWLVLRVGANVVGDVPPGLISWTAGPEGVEGGRQVFASTDTTHVNGLLDRMRVHSWGGAVRSLPAGTTEADLLLDSAVHTQADADAISGEVNEGLVTHLLIEEVRNPETCLPVNVDRERRQVLTLVRGSAFSVHDPDPSQPANDNAGTWAVHVRWREPLARGACITSTCGSGDTQVDRDDITIVSGNLVRATHGRLVTVTFKDPTIELNPLVQDADRIRHYERAIEPCAGVDDPCLPGAGGRPDGVVCRLPEEEGRLAYRFAPPGGELPSCSTLAVTVETAAGSEDWHECPSLVHSHPDDPHFMVETDELGRSVIRFGNGTNGRRLPTAATVVCTYQVGRPLEGNVGADSIVHFDTGHDGLVETASVTNPLDVSDGRDPEPIAQAIRRIPEAFRARQLRGVTLADYARRASEVPRVARAAARYAWTGSWRTVQVTVDPVGGVALDDDLRAAVMRHLDAVRLIGEDIELRGPALVPLEITVTLCVDPEVWPDDLRVELREAFSDRIRRDGRAAFFHPDRWTFGQDLHASEIAGGLADIPGIEHVVAIRMRRFGATSPATDAIVGLRANEIILVRNDPDRLEAGTITFELQGGRA